MFNLPKILEEIDKEADRRFAEDQKCPGGKTAKLYDVSMEIDMAVGELMRQTNEVTK